MAITRYLKIHQLTGDLAMDMWPLIEGFIERASKYHPFLGPDGLKFLVSADLVTVFVVTTENGVLGFAACEVVQYPSRRVANIVFAGGALGFLSSLTKELMDQIEAWAAVHGAESISLTGRPGWLRIARKHGWKAQRQVLASKELAYGGRRRA